MNPNADLRMVADWLKQRATSAHGRAGLAFAAHEDDVALALYDEADSLWRTLRIVEADIALLRGSKSA